MLLRRECVTLSGRQCSEMNLSAALLEYVPPRFTPSQHATSLLSLHVKDWYKCGHPSPAMQTESPLKRECEGGHLGAKKAFLIHYL
jgi:hypothetical protein